MDIRITRRSIDKLEGLVLVALLVTGVADATELGADDNGNAANTALGDSAWALGVQSTATGALSAAMSALVPNHRDMGDTQVSVGIGYYRGQNAMAAGMYHYASDRVLFNAGVSVAGDERAGRMGMTIGFGRRGR